MKRILTLLFLLSSFACGGLKVPRYVYGMENLGDAKSEAKEKGKPLAFVYTDPEST